MRISILSGLGIENTAGFILQWLMPRETDHWVPVSSGSDLDFIGVYDGC
jgi:hypothetical protein